MSRKIGQFNFGKTQVFTSERMRNRRQLSRLVYNIFGYTNVGNWARANIAIKLFKNLPLDKFNAILDLGAGLGEFSFMLAEALPETKIVALEILPERVSLLKETVQKCNFNNVTVFEDKIESFPTDGHFDFIFAIDVFEHIPEKEMPFSECLKKLKPGGYFMVKIPNVKQKTIMPESWFEDHHEWLEDEHVGQIYNLDGLVSRFKNEGFTIVHQSYSDGWFSRLGWEIGFLSKKGGAVIQLLFLPLCKFLVYIDRFVSGAHRKDGNAIQVIGQKKPA